MVFYSTKLSLSVFNIGASALAKKEAIVSRLTAVEEIAGMEILCSDKTGKRCTIH